MEERRDLLEERRELSRRVFGLDNEILQQVFRLDALKRETLFKHYETKYGWSAYDYARTVWDDWKNGTRGVSAEVATRFITLAPKVLSNDARYDVVAKMYDKTKRRETHSLTAILGIKEGALLEIEQLFERLCHKPFEHEWPDTLTTFANWLCEDDATAANKLIAAIDAERSLLIVEAAKAECKRLVEALRNLDAAVSGTHKIELPYGTISLHIRQATVFENFKKYLTSYAAEITSRLLKRNLASVSLSMAVCGSPLLPNVISLQKFRAKHLETNFVGRCFIRLYYCVGPFLANSPLSRGSITSLIRRLLGGWGRTKIAAAQKARWAKLRAWGTSARQTRTRMSAAVKARLAQIARASRRKARAAGKSAL